MEMNFNGEGDSEARKFVNFSIREYVAEVQRKDWKKCWPFKLFVDSKEPNCQVDVVSAPQLLETSDAPDNTQENTEAPNTSEVGISKVPKSRPETNTVIVASREIDNGKVKTIDDGSLSISSKMEGQCQNGKSVTEGATIECSWVVENDKQGNLRRRKPQKFRLLSEMFKDLADPCEAGSVHIKVNSNFTTVTDDESDDITLDAFIKKQKHAQVCGGALKKRKTRQVVEPRVDKVKRSKLGPEESLGNVAVVDSKCDSRKNLDIQTRKKRIKSSAEIRTQKDDKLLANASLSKDTETACDSIQRKTRESSPPTANEKTLALELLRLSEARMPSKIATKEPVLCSGIHKKRSRGKLPVQGDGHGVVPKRKRSCLAQKGTSGRLDGIAPPDSESITSQPQAAQRGCGVAQVSQRGRGTYICSMNMNPADFSIPNAENRFIRGV